MSRGSQRALVYTGVGIVSVLGIGSVAYYLSTRNSGKIGSMCERAVDRATVIQVLKELRKEMFTVFQNFSAVSLNIKQQSRGQAKPEEIKTMLLQQPMFRGEIDGVEDAVYEKFGLTREQVQHLCENVYREDMEIKALQKQMKDQFDKSFQGVAPDSKSTIPEFLTPTVTVEILEKVMLQSAQKLNSKLLELQEQGEQISFNNPKMMEIMSSLKMDGGKKEILNDYGLDKFEDSGSKILQFATQEYTKSNKEGFSEKMAAMDIKFQQIMEQILMSGPMSEADLQTAISRNDYAPPAGPFGMPPFPRQMHAHSKEDHKEDEKDNNSESQKMPEPLPKSEDPEQPKKEEAEPQNANPPAVEVLQSGDASVIQPEASE